VLIGGFIISGDVPKKVMLRAIGPSLAASGALANPTLALFDSSGAQVAFNDDWVNSDDKQAIMDTQIAPTNDKESAILQTLAPGPYTAKVASADNTTGLALVELYDLDSFGSSKAANISTRGLVQQGDDLLIGGFILGGSETQQIVVRGLGPSLANNGVANPLPDPAMELRDSQGTLIGADDNWQDAQKQELIDSQLAPSDPKESAIVANLQPGSYTAVISGATSGTGVALVEVYNVTPQ
jgi:hypothetical protein